ncbi:glycoside hydrolase family 16 protein [Spirosoma sp.]|uniref:glycoside hydrolase family 16 protein n=1 Tax=Spirosoma sp. TaxID=1899569 RepID=UPI003B3AF39A
MRSLTIGKVLAILAILTGVRFDTPAKPHDGPSPPVRKLVWADEFDKAGLPDSTKWKYEVGGNGWGNNELQFYTARRSENARVENGKLIIEARKEAYQGKNYTSARISSQNKQTWKYGRIEALAKLPKGLGTWPAIWMLGSNISTADWPTCGEIDIMEHVGYDEGVIHGTVHTEAYNHGKHTEKGDTLRVSNVASAFHLYAIEWTPDQIDFFVDNQKYYSVKKADLGENVTQWPFDQPFYLILNVAVGGNWGGKKGVDETIWPQRMEIDYVRVYQ